MAKETEKTPAISQLLLERYALGELSAEARADVEKKLAEDPQAQARLSEIRRTNEEILTAYPPEKVVANIERRARVQAAEKQTAPRKNYAILWPVTTALAVSALLVLILKPSPFITNNGTNHGTGNDPEITRLKGLKPTLLIFAKPRAGETPKPLASGATVRARTVLQLAYVAANQPHGVVLSIDGRGAATLHFPADASRSSQLESGQVSLPNAYELDDAPLFERFFFITSKKPIDVPAVVAAARSLAAADANKARLAPLNLSTDLEQTSTLLIKEGTGP